MVEATPRQADVSKRLHSMDPIKYPSSTCPLCKKEDEDEYHFVVG